MKYTRKANIGENETTKSLKRTIYLASLWEGGPLHNINTWRNATMKELMMEERTVGKMMEEILNQKKKQTSKFFILANIVVSNPMCVHSRI